MVVVDPCLKVRRPGFSKTSHICFLEKFKILNFKSNSSDFAIPNPSDESSDLNFSLLIQSGVSYNEGKTHYVQAFVIDKYKVCRGPPKFQVRCKFSLWNKTVASLEEPENEILPCDWEDDCYVGCSAKVDIEPGKILVRCLVELQWPDYSHPTINRRLSPRSFPDLYLVSDETRLPCHKHMLAACSDVFKAMFLDCNDETKVNEVPFTDVEPVVLEKLLEYVYTDTIDEMDGLTCQLIVAADKYDMANLKTFAVSHALYNLTVENVCDFLTLADLIQIRPLIQSATEFACKHYMEVMQRDEWKTLSKTCTDELFLTALKYNK